MKQSTFKKLALGAGLVLVLCVISPLFPAKEETFVDYAPEKDSDTVLISISDSQWQYAVGYRYQDNQLIPSRQLTTKDGTLAFVSITASGSMKNQPEETRLQSVVLFLNEIDRQIEAEIAATDRTAFDLDWSGTVASIKKNVEDKSRLEAKKMGFGLNDISIRVMLPSPNYKASPEKWVAIETYLAQCGNLSPKAEACNNLRSQP